MYGNNNYNGYPPPSAPGGQMYGAPPPSNTPPGQPLGPPGYLQPPQTQATPHQPPPSSSFGPPSMQGPPTQAGMGAPPGSMAAPASVRAPAVPFFSTAGGSIAPSAPAAPPSSMGVGMGAPPAEQFSSPGTGMPPPPMSGMGVGAQQAGMPPQFMPGPPVAGMLPGMMPSAMMGMQAYPAPETYGGFGQAAQGQDSSAVTTGAVQGAAGDSASAGAPLPTLAEMDLSVQCDQSFMRTTVGKIINSQAAANATRLPIGIVCSPMAGDVGTENHKIQVVDFGSTGIIRCRRCRTYINPFASWIDNGRRWRCNLCGMQNDVPSSYFSHLDSNGQRRDKDQRPELSCCSVEFVAPSEYMIRPPQPPVYFFVIDVSSVSATSGMLQSCVNAIKASLDEIPGSPRTQIGFITFDSTIHFYNLKSGLTSPQMHVISDVSDIILPLPEDLLVNLQESRHVVDALLDALPSMFSRSTTVNSCTGPALSAAKAVIGHVGGKLCLFQSSLPTVGDGTLKPRENPRLLGTDKEHSLLNPEVPWYKDNAIEFSRLQIAVDTFLFSGQYTDLATLSVLSKYTSGSCHYYPGFVGQRDGVKFERELHHCLTRATAFESVIRVRATRGLRITNFYGNYFVRGTDLLALPNCTSDSTFGLDIQYDETILSAQAITVQAALLYTSSVGERRIRVHTMLIPVTNSTLEMMESIDIDCTVNMLAKQAIDIAQKTGMDTARQRVHQVASEIIRSSKGFSQPSTAPGQYGYHQPAPQTADAPVPMSLQLLPLYAMSLQKSLVLRGGSEVRVDERAFFQILVQNMTIEESKVFVYPRMFSVHDMGADAGVPGDNADDDCPTAGPFRLRLPALLNLSAERLTSNGLFLLENGYDMFLWIGRALNPAIVSTLFGVPSLEGVNMSTLAVLADNSDFANRVNAIIVALRQDRARYMHLHFIREGDGYAEAYFSRYLVEDRANFPGGALSYTEYHTQINRLIG